jgi:hypothetical protein
MDMSILEPWVHVAKQTTYICISALNPDRIDWGKRKAGLTVAPVATIKVPYL